jgi:hypothetical protein
MVKSKSKAEKRQITRRAEIVLQISSIFTSIFLAFACWLFWEHDVRPKFMSRQNNPQNIAKIVPPEANKANASKNLPQNATPIKTEASAN